jgi:hypothetical protein
MAARGGEVGRMKFLQNVSIVVGAGSLAWGFYSAGQASVAGWTVLFGLAWLVAEFRRWRWFASLGLLACIALAGLGLWLNLPLGWMLAGAVGALIAWDLADFNQRIEHASTEDDVPGLTRRHLLRISIVTIGGLVLSLFSMLARLKFSFEWVTFLTILAAIGIVQLVSRMRKED